MHTLDTMSSLSRHRHFLHSDCSLYRIRQSIGLQRWDGSRQEPQLCRRQRPGPSRLPDTQVSASPLAGCACRLSFVDSNMLPNNGRRDDAHR